MKKNYMLMGAAVVLATLAYGQKDSVRTGVLDDVTVTANKHEQKQSSTGKVVNVISKAVLEKSAGKTLGQLLNEQAGVTINGALNALGTNQTLYLRGGASGRTLVLLDGVPVYDPSYITNDFDLNLIALNDVERIEICKGAQSTLYGSDAIAGVINIITVKDNVGKPLNLKATLSAGNLDTYKGNAQLYGKVAGLTYTARYAKLKTGGFSSANDKEGTGNFDNDGYNGDVAGISLKYDITRQFSAKTFLQYSRYKNDLDAGVFADSKDFTSANKSLMAGAGLHYKNEVVSITGNFQYSQIDRNTLDDSTDNPGTLAWNTYYGKAQFVELFANIKLGRHFTLLQGADYRNGSMNLSVFGTYPASPWGPAGTYGSTMDSAMSQASLYASLLFNGLDGRLNIDLGGRLNVNSRYGNNQSYTFNPSYKINGHIRLLGSISSAYKTPSVYQLYSEYGNQALKVEKSTSYELGLQVSNGKITNRLVYFYRDIKDGIDFNNILYQYFNINSQVVRGLEYEVQASPLKNLTLTANYTYLSAKENSQSRVNFKDTSYNYLLRRPKHSVNASIGYQLLPHLFASIGGKYVSERQDVGGYQAEDLSLDAYFIMNAYAEYQIIKPMKVFVDAQNLTDKKFFDLYGYNSIPFMINAGVTFNL